MVKLMLGRYLSAGRTFKVISPIVFLLSLCLLAACSNTSAGISKAVEDYAKSNGAKEVVTDLVYKDANSSDKAYVSATITHNYADAKGNFQREFLGYILRKDGNDWKIERNATYTKDEKKAQQLLAGQKIIP